MAARLARLALAGVIALAAGCATRPPPPTPPRPAVGELPAPPVALAAPLTPAAYVQRAASYDLLVIKAAELASTRSGDARVKALAETLAEEHRGLAAQLSLAGRRLDLLPAAILLPAHQQRLDALAGSSRFDNDWWALMRLVHQQSFAVHAAFARGGSSPTLRPVADHATTVERQHWALLK